MAGPGCIGINGSYEAFPVLVWSICFNGGGTDTPSIQLHRRCVGELWTVHTRVEVSISAMPAATHLPVSVTSYFTGSDINMCYWTCCIRKQLLFSVLSKRWKTNWQLHVDEGCICETWLVGLLNENILVSFTELFWLERLHLFFSFFLYFSLRYLEKNRRRFTPFKHFNTDKNWMFKDKVNTT